ncbi:churchill-like protein [Saccoglossus kowalevskii]|uniref:Protein Churchill n=1 Tax=Saccoglossus kowalevskii TaxID=10224 RepID=D1LWY6_SACKO|nr:churchill-like protein [Saccoglossus kowalevskii]ACY92492.1 churchill-like protein [Saccoglossus kowalevskii]
MCLDCVKQKCPDRGSMCLDSGAYLVNYHGCSECKQKEPLKTVDVQKDIEEDGEESVSYQHVCPNCMHVVAEHSYSFSVDGEFQDYNMFCMLCGKGSDTISINPTDPRKQQTLF